MNLYSVKKANLSPAEKALDVSELVKGGLESAKLGEVAGPMTNRSANRLALFYGYTGIRQLCADIPTGARVFDAGAGLSDLGHDVTFTRQDVSWTNFDLRYGLLELPASDRKTLAELQAVAPANLTYVSGNVFDLPAQVCEQSFDRGFSYYMFPHVIDNYGLKLARTAMENVLKLVKPNGSFSTGPNRYLDDGWTITLPEHQQVRELAADMVKRYVESWNDYEQRGSDASSKS